MIGDTHKNRIKTAVTLLWWRPDYMTNEWVSPTQHYGGLEEEPDGREVSCGKVSLL